MRDGAAQTAEADVRRERQASAGAGVPQLRQRRGQERQQPRLGVRVRDHGIDQPLVEDQAASSSRELDRTTYVIGVRRPHQHRVVSRHRGQTVVVGEPLEVVGPQHQDHARPAIHVAAATSASVSRNATRSRSSLQLVQASSNWSTTSTVR